jgi:hypothetical protein
MKIWITEETSSIPEAQVRHLCSFWWLLQIWVCCWSNESCIGLFCLFHVLLISCASTWRAGETKRCTPEIEVIVTVTVKSSILIKRFYLLRCMPIFSLSLDLLDMLIKMSINASKFRHVRRQLLFPDRIFSNRLYWFQWNLVFVALTKSYKSGLILELI